MLGRAIGCVCCNFTVAFGKAPVPAPEAGAIGAVPGARGALTIGRPGGALARGAVVAPVSMRGAPGTAGGAPGATGRGAIGAAGGAPGTEGGRGAAIGTVAAGGGPRGRAGGGTGMAEGGALGTGDATTGTADVVLREIGAGGSFTGAVADFGAGGGRGAEGSWIGAVARFGVMSGVIGITGEVASRGWVAPAPGRARRVMRTVSFFKGTAAVFGVLGGGGVGVFSDSLMMKSETANISDLYI